MWVFLLACADDCDPGFEARDSRCYWSEASDASPQLLLDAVLAVPLPDPISVARHYQNWMQHADASCPGENNGVWDNPGCTTEEGVEFAGKAVFFWAGESESGAGEVRVDMALLSSVVVRDGERFVEMGGVASYDAVLQEQGYDVRSKVTGDFFETPEQEPWMADGLGHSLYAHLDTHSGVLELDGGMSHPSADLYFENLVLVDGCPQGQVLVHEHLAQGWTELNWNCGCGTVDRGPLEGQEFCAPLAERAAELQAVLQEPLP